MIIVQSLKHFGNLVGRLQKKKVSETSMKVFHTLNLLEHGLYETIA